MRSNWSRHEFEGSLQGSYEKPFDENESDQPELEIDSSLRLDLIDGMTLTSSLNYNLSTESFTSTTLAPGAIDNPLLQRIAGSLALQRDDRRLQYTLRGGIDRDIFDDAELSGGTTFSQEDRNNTDYSLSLRLGYEVSPAITPFVETAYTSRVFDLAIDRNGNRRDSDIYELRGGLELDFNEKLRGELALGYVSEEFEDPHLETLDGVSFNAALDWSPEEDTTVRLSVTTDTNSSISANENGTFIYNTRLDLERQISDRLTMTGFAGLQFETNNDNNKTTEVGLGLRYWINRFAALTTNVEYNKFTTDSGNSDFDEFQGRIGIRLQK